MIDTRDLEKLEKIKANKDSQTFKFDINKTLPMLQMQILTSINTWSPSVHLLQNNTILLAIADELRIHKDITYGKLTKASDKVI